MNRTRVEMQPRLLAAMLGSIVAMAVLAACAGGTSSPTPIAAATAVTLASATNTACVTPSTSAQSVALPATGGVTATIAFGAFSSAATGCDTVVISTGADAVTALSTMRSAQRLAPAANANSTAPLLTISVGEAFGSSGPVSAFGYETIVSGMQLTVSPNLNFPDGTYYATVTASGQTFVIPFTAKGGVLTVAAGSAGLPVAILAGSSALISLYQQGYVPSASPAPSASASASAAPSASPSASPSPAPSGSAPAAGTVVGSISYVSDAPAGVASAPPTTTPIVYDGSGYPVATGGGGIVAGTYSYTLLTGALNAQSYRVDGCSGRVVYSGTGSSGVFTIPYGVVFQTADTCQVDFFSVPASVVNAAPDFGFAYDIFVMYGPVAVTLSSYPPAVNL